MIRNVLIACFICLYLPKLISQDYKCHSFYLNYGLHLVENNEKELGFQYLEKADEIGISYDEVYVKMVDLALNLDKDTSLVLYLFKRFFETYEEEANYDLIKDFPVLTDFVKDYQQEDKIRQMALDVNWTARQALDFNAYLKLKNLIYVDQFHRRRSTKFTEDREIRIKIDTTVLTQLYEYVEENKLADDIAKMGSGKDHFFIILLHNSRLCMPTTYEKVEYIKTKLLESGIMGTAAFFLLEDEHAINCGQHQLYGQGMALWEGDDLVVFPTIENIEHIDSLRVSNYMLPLQYRIDREQRSYKGRRTVKAPEGYLFDEDWKKYCKCTLIE